jgi:hypothetical protein
MNPKRKEGYMFPPSTSIKTIVPTGGGTAGTGGFGKPRENPWLGSIPGESLLGISVAPNGRNTRNTLSNSNPDINSVWKTII